MKKQNILLVYKILEAETDAEHRLTQKQIVDIISAKYPCDRKTVARNIAFLRDMGYPIVKTSTGYYLDRKNFGVDECRMIVSAIEKSEEIPAELKPSIIGRLYNALYRINRSEDD